MRNKYEIDGRDLWIRLDRQQGPDLYTVTNVFMKPMLDRYDVKWCAMRDYTTKIEEKFYVVATLKGKTIMMHRLLMEADVGSLIDHIDHDRLNNRLRNLRVASPSLNALNRERAEQRSTTGILGVFHDTTTDRWRARVKYKQKSYFEKWFDNMEDARRAVEKARKQLMKKLERSHIG